jgi:hypothetical protein
VPSFFISPNDNIEENDEIDENTRKNVKAVKAGNKEEKVGEKRTSILIPNEVGAFNNMYGLRNFIYRVLSV